jgi:predicted RNase H-like HicB family nuclease
MRVQVYIVVEPDGDGFHAYAPALPGLHADGQTEDEARRNAAELAVLYLASMVKHGDPLPIGGMAEGEGQNVVVALAS